MRTRSAVSALGLSLCCFAMVLSGQTAGACRITLTHIDTSQKLWIATVESEGLEAGDHVYVRSRLQGTKGPWMEWTRNTKDPKVFWIYVQPPLRTFTIQAVAVKGEGLEGKVADPVARCSDTKTATGGGSGSSGKP